MRKTLYTALTSASALTALVPAERWFEAGAVVDHPDKMFAVVRWLSPVPSTGSGRWLNQLRIDVHDKRGSYKRIEQLLGNPYSGGGIYDVLTGLVDFVGADGRITQCDYLNHSGDQESEEYGTNYKFTSWQVIGVTTA
jgi:hypothetical protein